MIYYLEPFLAKVNRARACGQGSARGLAPEGPCTWDIKPSDGHFDILDNLVFEFVFYKWILMTQWNIP